MPFHAGNIMRARWPPKSRLIQFALFCAVSFVAELALDHAIESADASPGAGTQRLFDVASIYHYLVTLQPRKPHPRFTSLISIGEKTAPTGISYLNVCRERLFLGEVLKTLVHVHPKVVVIDKYF